MKVTFILIVTFISLFFTVSLQASGDFIHAMALISQGKQKESYPFLEKAYHDDSISNEERGHAALILAFVDNKNLKKAKRHEYAEYTINHPKFIPTKKDRFALLRIMGDGFFEVAKLNKAATAYKMLSKSDDPEDVDYAHYKLAWIDLNRDEPFLAFHRLYTRIVDGKNRALPQGLHKSLIRDLGRSWAETQPPQDSQLESVLKLNLNPTEAVEFEDGIASGLRRMDQLESIAIFRAQLVQTKYILSVLRRVLSHGIGLTQEPCYVLDWFGGPIGYQDVNIRLVMPWLNTCYKSIQEKDPTGVNHIVTLKNLELAYAQLPSNGLNRWALANLYQKTNQYLEACSQFAMMSQELLDFKKEPMPTPIPPEAFNDLIYTCGQAAQESQNAFNKDSTLIQNLLEIIEANASGHPHSFNGLVAKLITMASFKEQCLNRMLRHPEIYKKTLIPALVVEALPSKKRSEYAETLLNLYAPQPIVKEEKEDLVWLELLRSRVNDQLKDKKYLEVEGLLKTFVGLEKTSFEKNHLSELWMLWALAIPTDAVQLVETKNQVTTLYFETMTEKGMASQTTAALAFSLKFDQMKPLWKAWKKLDLSSPKNAPFLSDFYQRTFQMLIENKIRTEDVGGSSQGNTIVQAYKVLKNPIVNASLEKTLGQIQSSTLGLPQALRPAFLKDAQAVYSVVQTSHKATAETLAFSTSLPERIETKIETIRKQMNLLKTHTWSHPAWAKLASRIIAQTCDTTSAQIEKIKYPKDFDEAHARLWMRQLQPIVNTIGDWKKTLISQASSHERVL